MITATPRRRSLPATGSHQVCASLPCGPPGKPLVDLAALREYLASGFGEVRAWSSDPRLIAAPITADWDDEQQVVRFSTRPVASRRRSAYAPRDVAHPRPHSQWRRQADREFAHTEPLFDGSLWTRAADRAIRSLRSQLAASRSN